MFDKTFVITNIVASNIIFSRKTQQCVCRDKTTTRAKTFLAAKLCLLRQIFVAAKLCLLRQIFVATKFCYDEHMFVATNIILSRQVYFFCDKRRAFEFSRQKMMLLSAPANDTPLPLWVKGERGTRGEGGWR